MFIYLAIVVISHFLLYQFIQQKQFLSLTTTEISKGSIVLPIDINLCLRFCVLYGSDFDVYFILLSLISQFMCLDYVSLVAELCPKTVLLLGDVRVCSTFYFFSVEEKKKTLPANLDHVWYLSRTYNDSDIIGQLSHFYNNQLQFTLLHNKNNNNKKKDFE